MKKISLKKGPILLKEFTGKTGRPHIKFIKQRNSRTQKLCCEETHNLDSIPISNQSVSDNQENGTIYYQNLHESENGWHEKHTELYSAMCFHLGPHSFCQICSSSDPLFRCMSCSLSSVCEFCLQQQHRHSPPHVVQKWMGNRFESWEMNSSIGPICGCASSKYLHTVKCFTMFGFVTTKISYCSCDSGTLLSTIVKSGYWSDCVEMDKITIIFPLNFLKLVDSLVISAKASLQAVCSSFNWSFNVWDILPGNLNIYRVLQNFGCLAAFRRAYHSLTAVDVNDKIMLQCPGCYQSNEFLGSDVPPDDVGPRFALLDGCFGLKHRATAGKAALPLISEEDPLFVPVNFDDNEEHGLMSCENWRAGRSRATAVRKADTEQLDVHGAFAASCKHQSWLGYSDITTVGERMAYSVNMARRLLPQLQPFPVLVYDIACKLPKSVAEKCTCVVPAFHAYGHVMSCQLKHGIRSTPGVGLCEGEGQERQWSSLRRYSVILKEMTHPRRLELIRHIIWSENHIAATSITKRLKQSAQLILKTEREIKMWETKLLGENLQLLTGDLGERVLNWTAEEKEKADANARLRHSRCLNTVQWLRLLYAEAAERKLLHSAIKSVRGQRMYGRLKAAVKSSVKKTKKLLKKQPASDANLVLQDVISVNSIIFKQIDADVLQEIEGEVVPRPVRLEAIRLFHLKRRLAEEPRILAIEVRRATHYFLHLAETARSQLTSAFPISIPLVHRYDGLVRILAEHAIAFASEQNLIASRFCAFGQSCDVASGETVDLNMSLSSSFDDDNSADHFDYDSTSSD